jgi:hypothetical protein
LPNWLVLLIGPAFCNFNLVLHGATSILLRDEEYDRGKRKKPRQSMHNFDGPNLLQAFATKKTQVKKAKIDRSRSGNQPFRIWSYMTFACGIMICRHAVTFYVAIVAVFGLNCLSGLTSNLWCLPILFSFLLFDVYWGSDFSYPQNLGWLIWKKL